MGRTALSTKINIATVSILVVLGGIGGVAWARHDEPSPKPAASVAVEAAPTTSLSYSGKDGQTALALLKKHAAVQTKPSSLGEYVTAINGNDGGGKKYWLFYIDGKEASEGAATYVTNSGQTIEWRLQ